MSARNAFGPNLRRVRVQRGVSIDQIVNVTCVRAALWEGLERNDFSLWPKGIYARSYIRSYARSIGVDPETTVDDFCRWFPQGDRRAEIVIRGQAEIVGHKVLRWRDQVPPTVAEGDRRAAAPQPSATGHASGRKTTSPLVAFSQMFIRLRALLRT